MNPEEPDANDSWRVVLLVVIRTGPFRCRFVWFIINQVHCFADVSDDVRAVVTVQLCVNKGVQKRAEQACSTERCRVQSQDRGYGGAYLHSLEPGYSGSSQRGWCHHPDVWDRWQAWKAHWGWAISFCQWTSILDMFFWSRWERAVWRSTTAVCWLFWPVSKLKLVQVLTLMWLSSEHCGTFLVRFSEKQTVSAMQRWLIRWYEIEIKLE